VTPRHHLSEGLLVAYASGAASDAEALVAASHLTFCPVCRTEVTRQEEVAARFLADAAPEKPPLGAEGETAEALLAGVLARLDEAPRGDVGSVGLPRDTSAVKAVWRSGKDAVRLPSPLRKRLAVAETARFGFLAPGIKGIDLPTATQGVRLRLMRLAGGISIPSHDHAGSEYTLVLGGAFEDETAARYGVGDLCVRETGEPHLQHVTRGEPCFALQLNEGPLLPLTWKGRLLSALFDRPFQPASG
jgi:putative transcriptional regulator